jgi:hypothetical protein
MSYTKVLADRIACLSPEKLQELSEMVRNKLGSGDSSPTALPASFVKPGDNLSDVLKFGAQKGAQETPTF